MLEFKNVSKYYGNGFFNKKQSHVFKNISFKVQKGEILGLYGKSGSGKTTIARIALKLTRPSSGSIIFNGEDITLMKEPRFRPLRSRIQILFQHPEQAFNPLMTLKQSIYEAYAKTGVPRQQRFDRLETDLAKYHLPMTLMKRFPHQVSGGEIQRAVLIRVLSFNPDILVMDEPTSMLDVSEQAHILQLIKQRCTEMNMGVLLISHDQYVIKAMCNEMVKI